MPSSPDGDEYKVEIEVLVPLDQSVQFSSGEQARDAINNLDVAEMLKQLEAKFTARGLNCPVDTDRAQQAVPTGAIVIVPGAAPTTGDDDESFAHQTVAMTTILQLIAPLLAFYAM